MNRNEEWPQEGKEEAGEGGNENEGGARRIQNREEMVRVGARESWRVV